MMLLSLALIRHSVLSLSEGLAKIQITAVIQQHLFLKTSSHKETGASHFVFTDLSTNMVGESGRVVSRSFMAFHSLMQLWSEPMELS